MNACNLVLIPRSAVAQQCAYLPLLQWRRTYREARMLYPYKSAVQATQAYADLCLALAKAKTLEHVREYETAMQERTNEEREVAMQFPEKYWRDSSPVAKVKQLIIVVGA